MKSLNSKMSDSVMYETLQKFANSLSIVEGGRMQVSITQGNTHVQPKYPGEGRGFKYEDSEYLCRTLDGATSFLFWFRRQGEEKKHA